MSGGIRPQPEDRLAAFVAELDKIRADIRELQRPTGTQIAETVANQVAPAVGNSSTSGFTLSTSEATLITLNVAVPDGFSRAVVSVVGSVTGMTTSSGDRMFNRCYIGGSVGPTSTTILAVATPWQVGVASYAASLTGLSGGNVTCLLRAWLQAGPGGSTLTNATLTASAVFLR